MKFRENIMKPMGTCQRTLSYISVFPAEENTSKLMKIFFKVFPLIIFTNTLFALIIDVLYILRFVSTNLEDCLTALFQIAGMMGLMNSFIVTFIKHRELLAMIKSLEKIYRSNSDEGKFQYLAQADTRTEWAWGIFKKYAAACGTASCIIMPVVSVLFLIIQNKPYEFDSVYHTFYVLLPWNRDNLLGYIFEICYNTNITTIFFFVSGNELILFFSVCWHHQAFYQIFRHTVRTFDSPDKKRSDKLNILHELIQFHNLVKVWFLETANFLSPYILFKMLTFMMFLASNVFQLDLQFQHLGLGICTVLTAFTISLSNLLLYCLFGKLATESFENMSDCLYESNWPNLPTNLQKYLILMIANAQIPLNYHGSGMIYLNLGTLLTMLKTVFSYYMMFKAFTR